MDLNSYQERKKLIKQVIFWSILIGGLLALLFIQTSTAVSAQQQSGQPIDVCGVVGNCLEGTNTKGRGGTAIVNTILSVVYFFIYISAAVAVGYIVISAYKMVTASGNEDKYKEGLKGVQYAVVGLIFAIISITLVSLVTEIVPGLSL